MTMNTAAEADAIATATTSALLDSALDRLKLTIESTAKSAYDALAMQLADNIRAHVTNYVAERVGDHTQFGYSYADVRNNPLPAIGGVKYLVTEAPIVWHQPSTSRPVHIITNYGRYIVGKEQYCPANQRLTVDIMKCIRALVNELPGSYKPYPGVVTALRAVDTITSNTVHNARVEKCKVDAIVAAKAEFDAEMNASNKRLREECSAEIAARQRELGERQAELNARMAALDARQAELDERQAALDARQAEQQGRAEFNARLHKFQSEINAIRALVPMFDEER